MSTFTKMILAGIIVTVITTVPLVMYSFSVSGSSNNISTNANHPTSLSTQHISNSTKTITCKPIPNQAWNFTWCHL